MSPLSLPEAALAISGEGCPFVLVTLMDQNGSVPRKAGAYMLVRPDGEIWGTMGGGYEDEVINLSRRLLRENAFSTVPESPEGSPGAVVKYAIRDNTNTGTMCSRVTLLLEVVFPDTRSNQLFTAALEAGLKLQPFVFLTSFLQHEATPVMEQDSPPREGEVHIGPGEVYAGIVQRYLYLQEEQKILPNKKRSLPSNLLAIAESLADTPLRHIVQGGTDYLLEHFERPFRIIIFGGGHVGHKLAPLARRVGFPVAVVDDRQKFANAENFPHSEIVVPESLSEDDALACMHTLHVGPRDAIVIVTRGHSHDRDVLAASLRTTAGYIGMIGSKSKRADIYNCIRDKGFSQKQLDFVHSPIGLPIGASSPLEIAVSIVAELIQWRKEARDVDRHAKVIHF